MWWICWQVSCIRERPPVRLLRTSLGPHFLMCEVVGVGGSGDAGCTLFRKGTDKE